MAKGQKAPKTPQQTSWSAVARIVKAADGLLTEDLALVVAKLQKRLENSPDAS